MKPEDIKLSDWKRILFGQVPIEFYLELAIRGALAYLLLIISMRMLGKKMAAGTSNLEVCAIVALGSAIGVPLLSPMNGMLPAFIITFFIIAITKTVSWLSTKSRKFEKTAQEEFDMLVCDGVMNLGIMKRVRVSRERLFAELRSSNLFHLGKVRRMYMEPNGSFSLIQDESDTPGLMVLPDWDKAFIAEEVTETNTIVCKECGERRPQQNSKNRDIKCPNCGSNKWTQAVVER